MTFQWVRGEAITDPPESLQLFGLCEAMRWNHLPVFGGIYDQHPELLRQWRIIWEIKGEYEQERQKREQRSKGR